MNEYQQLAIKALRDTRGDDLERVRIRFAGCTPEQMAEPMAGLIKQSRQDIVDWHIERVAKIDAAIAWLEGLK
jgi:hypothetical protein